MSISQQILELLDELCDPDRVSWEDYAGILNAVSSECEVRLDCLAEEHGLTRRDLNAYDDGTK